MLINFFDELDFVEVVHQVIMLKRQMIDEYFYIIHLEIQVDLLIVSLEHQCLIDHDDEKMLMRSYHQELIQWCVVDQMLEEENHVNHTSVGKKRIQLIIPPINGKEIVRFNCFLTNVPGDDNTQGV
jgi:hypothetical protein